MEGNSSVLELVEEQPAGFPPVSLPFTDVVSAGSRDESLGDLASPPDNTASATTPKAKPLRIVLSNDGSEVKQEPLDAFTASIPANAEESKVFTQAEPSIPAITISHRDNAELIFKVSTGILCGIFGTTEWQADNQPEANSVIDPLEATLKECEIETLPAKWLLALAIASYSAKRFARPTTKQKLIYAWGKVKNFFSNMFKRKQKA